MPLPNSLAAFATVAPPPGSKLSSEPTGANRTGMRTCHGLIAGNEGVYVRHLAVQLERTIARHSTQQHIEHRRQEQAESRHADHE